MLSVGSETTCLYCGVDLTTLIEAARSSPTPPRPEPKEAAAPRKAPDASAAPTTTALPEGLHRSTDEDQMILARNRRKFE